MQLYFLVTITYFIFGERLESLVGWRMTLSLLMTLSCWILVTVQSHRPPMSGPWNRDLSADSHLSVPFLVKHAILKALEMHVLHSV